MSPEQLSTKPSWTRCTLSPYPRKVMQYTRAKAEIENKEGGKFAMLDGKIQGKFISLRPGQYIKMDWKFNEWSNFSLV